jgi:uncharacterized protein YdiU (UPF0061 family)
VNQREYVMGEAMHALGITTTRALAVVATGDEVARRWQARLADPDATAKATERVNPGYIPRHHLMESALVAATAEDREPRRRFLDGLALPFDERLVLAEYAAPAPASFGDYRTFRDT